jgi:hypothetical protein
MWLALASITLAAAIEFNVLALAIQYRKDEPALFSSGAQRG